MKRFDIKGFRVEACLGASKCPNSAHDAAPLAKRIIRLFETENLLAFLQAHVEEPLKYHHEFKVAVSDCPNACSRPQIKDIGIIGAVLPVVTDIACTECVACARNCQEHAIVVDTTLKKPTLDLNSCVKCGQCVTLCPTHTLAVGKKGFRVQVGGKLGRHPQLATELPGIYTEDEVVSIVSACISFYKTHGGNGRRFGALLNRFGLDVILGKALP